MIPDQIISHLRASLKVIRETRQLLEVIADEQPMQRSPREGLFETLDHLWHSEQTLFETIDSVSTKVAREILEEEFGPDFDKEEVGGDV